MYRDLWFRECCRKPFSLYLSMTVFHRAPSLSMKPSKPIARKTIKPDRPEKTAHLPPTLENEYNIVQVWTSKKFMSSVLYTCRKFNPGKAIEFIKEYFDTTEKIVWKEFYHNNSIRCTRWCDLTISSFEGENTEWAYLKNKNRKKSLSQIKGCRAMYVTILYFGGVRDSWILLLPLFWVLIGPILLRFVSSALSVATYIGFCRTRTSSPRIYVNTGNRSNLTSLNPSCWKSHN